MHVDLYGLFLGRKLPLQQLRASLCTDLYVTLRLYDVNSISLRYCCKIVSRLRTEEVGIQG